MRLVLVNTVAYMLSGLPCTMTSGTEVAPSTAYGAAVAAGGVFAPGSDAGIAAAALCARKMHSRGQTGAADAVMLAAYSVYVASGISPVSGADVEGADFDFSSGGPSVLKQLVAGAILNGATVIVEVAFNAQVSLWLGTATTPDLFFGPGDIDLRVPGEYHSARASIIGASDLLQLTVGSGATVGEGYIVFATKE